MKKTNGEVQSTPKKYTPEEFANEFKSLCDRMGFCIVALPEWIARDDGTFSMKIDWTVNKLPKQSNVDNQAVLN